MAFEERAKLKSPKISGDKIQCLEFWYHIYGSRVGELSVYLKIENASDPNQQTAEPMWKKTNSHGDYWNLGHVTYAGYDSSVTNFIIEAYTGDEEFFFGDIAIDDIAHRFGVCEDASHISVSCDFEEEHICGYTTDPLADFNWIRNKGKTESDKTGPIVDVTTGTKNGYYMYTEASDRKAGEKARLITPVESVSGFNPKQCLYFYYHAYGKDMGSFNIYSIRNSDFVQNKTQSSLNPLWTVSGDLGNNWYFGSVSTGFSSDYRIMFEGVVGNGPLSDVAIDDVFMSVFPCKTPGNCNFEDGDFDLCSWMNVGVSEKDFDWELYSPLLASQLQLPVISDNTVGDSGRFMVANFNSRRSNKKAVVMSEKLDATTLLGSCLTFYFYFTGGK